MAAERGDAQDKKGDENAKSTRSREADTKTNAKKDFHKHVPAWFYAGKEYSARFSPLLQL